MPLLDVSEVLSDPLFTEPMNVYRRTETVGSNGRTVITRTRVRPVPTGVIMPKDSVIGGNAIQRNPDEQHRGSALLIYTQFRLRGPSPGFQPDVVVWNGDDYVVTLVNDYSHYGAGYIQVELSSMTSVDNPPSEDFNG